ncbi:hypothetical protein Y032_0173g401 [Ancylostoma ceylanicum]|uniref:Uncharacterized protein n=1 Tax=Ancylostoma ceylanicum TaxID=53326 RepID=A0A016SV69_9BILA|nr:hypothetical protein Y032_0173g401 [Ancylostoma ceylanicum]
MQDFAGSLPGLADGDHGGRCAVNPEHCIAETAEQNLRSTLDLQRSGTTNRDRFCRTESAALITEPSGLLFERVFVR